MAAAHSLARSKASGGSVFSAGRFLNFLLLVGLCMFPSNFRAAGHERSGFAGNWRRNAGPGKKVAWGRAPQGEARMGWLDIKSLLRIYFFEVSGARFGGQGSGPEGQVSQRFGWFFGCRPCSGRTARDGEIIHNQRDAARTKCDDPGEFSYWGSAAPRAAIWPSGPGIRFGKVGRILRCQCGHGSGMPFTRRLCAGGYNCSGGHAANIYLGGGLIPDIGAVMVGGLVWLIGRTAKAAFQCSAPRRQGQKRPTEVAPGFRSGAETGNG
jgi:hypothetical protein